MLAASIYAILSADAGLDEWVGRYTPFAGATAQKSIFTSPPPPAATLPMVSSIGNLSDAPVITAGPILRDITRDITLIAAASDDPAEIEDAADALYTALWNSQSSISESGYACIAFHPSAGPRVAPTDETLRGRVITVRARLERL